MNIELSYSEAIDIKNALQGVIQSNEEALKDENFKEQWPACYHLNRSQVKRCQSIQQKLQTELDRL